MSNTRRHFVIAWALIVAQLLVVGLSQGQMIMCHKANGSSHIELVGEYAAGISNAEFFGRGASSSPDALLSSCSDAPCVDELFSFGFTIVRVRDIESGQAMGFLPIAEPAEIMWTGLVIDPVGSQATSWGVSDALPLIEQRVHIRSTVLIL